MKVFHKFNNLSEICYFFLLDNASSSSAYAILHLSTPDLQQLHNRSLAQSLNTSSAPGLVKKGTTTGRGGKASKKSSLENSSSTTSNIGSGKRIVKWLQQTLRRSNNNKDGRTRKTSDLMTTTFEKQQHNESESGKADGELTQMDDGEKPWKSLNNGDTPEPSTPLTPEVVFQWKN